MWYSCMWIALYLPLEVLQDRQRKRQEIVFYCSAPNNHFAPLRGAFLCSPRKQNNLLLLVLIPVAGVWATAAGPGATHAAVLAADRLLQGTASGARGAVRPSLPPELSETLLWPGNGTLTGQSTESRRGTNILGVYGATLYVLCELGIRWFWKFSSMCLYSSFISLSLLALSPLPFLYLKLSSFPL